MSDLLDVLKEQYEIEEKNACQKLTSGNLDTIYKILTVMHYLGDKTEDVTVYSNGTYDHNIDELYATYVAVKKLYHDKSSEENRSRMLESLGKLMSEVYDMLTDIRLSCDIREERQAVDRKIRALADM